MPDASAPGRPRRRALRWLLGASLVALAFVTAANLYLIASSRPAVVAGVAAAPARPYAIVLGNRVFPDGTPSDELAARLQTALALHRAGRAGKLVVSGMVRGAYDEPRAMAAWLEARGVPAGDIVRDGGGHRTAATMADAAALGIRSALVVTQDYHLPRALYFARHAGIDALGVPAPSRIGRRLVAARVFLRESAARAETVVEVALRGVR
ncbi:MAG TPA: ElyC/SanA/YdcF family protein [Polyangia bacterium]|jgi:SanA protein